MTIVDVRHQSAAQHVLQRALVSDRLPHAYIFHGPEGVGREMMAAQFAAVLLCHQPHPAQIVPPEYAHLPIQWMQSCGSCLSCSFPLIQDHPDLHIVHRRLSLFHEKAEVRKLKAIDLGIPVIRQFVIDPAGKRTMMGGAKVFILRECERLNASAQNALLKTLEEPPAQTYIILLTHSLDDLLPTTRSRCQSVPFRRLPSDFVAEQLRALRPDLREQEVHYFAHHEPGSLGSALSLADDGYYACNESLRKTLVELRRSDSLKLAEQLESLGKEMGKTVKERLEAELEAQFAELGTFEKQGDVDEEEDEEEAAKPFEISLTDTTRQALQNLLSLTATFYRDLLTLTCVPDAIICNSGLQKELSALTGRGISAAIEAIRSIAVAEAQLNLNAHSRLCLDNLGIQLARSCDR